AGYKRLRSATGKTPKRWVNQLAPKYSTLPKFGFVVRIGHPDPAKRGGRTSSRAADRVAVDVSSAVADASCRAGQWIEPSPVSDLQAVLYERRLMPCMPSGEAGQLAYGKTVWSRPSLLRPSLAEVRG